MEVDRGKAGATTFLMESMQSVIWRLGSLSFVPTCILRNIQFNFGVLIPAISPSSVGSVPCEGGEELRGRRDDGATTGPGKHGSCAMPFPRPGTSC